MSRERGGRDWRVQRGLGTALVAAGIVAGLLYRDVPLMATFMGFGAAFVGVTIPYRSLPQFWRTDDQEDPKP